MAADEKESRLLKYLDGLVEKLRGLAARAVSEGDVETIHDARVATRRLKAAAELLRPIVSKRHRSPLQKISRTLRRRLGRLRDLDVMLQHLAELKSPRVQPAAQWATERFTKARKKAMVSAAADLPTPRVLSRLGSWYALREELATAGEAVGAILAESVHLQLDAFAEAANRMIEPGAAYDPHQLRITGKSLRYTLEMAKADGTPLPRAVLSGFRRMQTSLGLWHDYVVLAEQVVREASRQELAFHAPLLQQSVLSLAAAALRRSQRQLEKVAEFWRAGGMQLIEQIRGTFPLTVAAEAPAAAEAAATVEAPVSPEPIADPHTAP